MSSENPGVCPSSLSYGQDKVTSQFLNPTICSTTRVINNQRKVFLNYNGNGNTGGSVPIDGLSPYFIGSTVIVLGNTGSLTKTGYTFGGWNTAADGSGTTYLAASSFLIYANTTLYALWIPV